MLFIKSAMYEIQDVLSPYNEAPYSVVALRSDAQLGELFAHLHKARDGFWGKLSWRAVSDSHIVVIIQGIDNLGDLLSFLQETFARSCSSQNTGFGIARYPLEGLDLKNLVAMSIEASSAAFNDQSVYQISDRRTCRRIFSREVREACAN